MQRTHPLGILNNVGYSSKAFRVALHWRCCAHQVREWIDLTVDSLSPYRLPPRTFLQKYWLELPGEVGQMLSLFSLYFNSFGSEGIMHSPVVTEEIRWSTLVSSKRGARHYAGVHNAVHIHHLWVQYKIKTIPDILLCLIFPNQLAHLACVQYR